VVCLQGAARARAQVEADIRPFRGLLLGLFFVTTGASLDVGLLLREWEIVAALLVGLIAVKVLIIGSLAPFFGLNRRALVSPPTPPTCAVGKCLVMRKAQTGLRNGSGPACLCSAWGCLATRGLAMLAMAASPR